MKQNRLFPILLELGLNEAESLVYELLLEHGIQKARDLTVLAGIGRGNVYNALMALKKRGLILATEGKQTTFQAVDPNKLQALLEAKVEETRRLETAYAGSVREMESAYALSMGRPTFQIFEGIEGAKRALEESLESNTEILTYFDVKALVTGPMAEVNRSYVKKRIARKIMKRLIVADTPEAHAFFVQQNTPYTAVAYLPHFPEQHATGMEIYDGTVSYVLLKNDKRISLLVRDQGIYELHRAQFEYLWSQAKQVVDYAARLTDAAEGTGSKTT